MQVTAREHVTLEAGLVGLPRARLVIAHQARVAEDINDEDRGEATTGSATARVRIVLLPASACRSTVS